MLESGPTKYMQGDKPDTAYSLNEKYTSIYRIILSTFTFKYVKREKL